MKKPIVIVLWDSNLFFLQAMKIIIKQYFYSRGIPTIFKSINDTKFADLVVTTSLPQRHGQERCGSIVIRKNIGEEAYLQQEISLKEQPKAIEHQLDKLFMCSSEGMGLIAQPHPQAITRRELEVLKGIAVELSPMQIARQLNISRKTVSSHKYTAMRKLGFSRTHDLYHWLLQGGCQWKESCVRLVPSPNR
ncbi:response regulator transcription factor [Serratia sp. L9]|uniref:response regulator transcription factor n=1 Tax=Serratia sp. L9 TaxID=3423946 RepID=UPI003D66CCE1